MPVFLPTDPKTGLPMSLFGGAPSILPGMERGANWLMSNPAQTGDQTDASYLAQNLARGVAQLPYKLFNTPNAILQQTVYPAVRELFTTPNERAARANPAMAAPTTPFDPNNPMADVMGPQAMQPNYLQRAQDAVRAIGGNVTSTMRSPARNAGVGGVGDSMHLSGEALDIAKTPGMSLDKIKSTLAAQGLQVTEALDEGSHFHVGWRPGGGAPVPNDPFSLTGLANPAMNPQAQAYRAGALGDMASAAAAATTPQAFSGPEINVAPPPAPGLATPTDFSAVEAELNAAKPVMDTEKEQLKIRRQAWMAGIGKALSSYSPGEGLGALFAHIGGGALQGAAAGDAEVRARSDKYDEEMVQWHRAMAQGDLVKAQDAHQTALANLATMNQYAMKKWEIGQDNYLRNNTFHVTDQGVTTTRSDGKGGVTGKFIPFAGPALAGIYAGTARLKAGFAGDVQQGALSVDAPLNALIVSHAAAGFAGSGAGGLDAAVQAPAFLVGQMVATGQAADLLDGPEGKTWKGLQKEISQRTGIPLGMPLNEQQQEIWNTALTAALTKPIYDPKNRAYREKVFSGGALGTNIISAQNLAGGKTRNTVDSRGRAQSQTTYSGMTNNPFGGQ